MPQLHFYVAEPIAKALRRKAKHRKIPVSRYLAEVAARDVEPASEWPKDYFTKVLGAWKGEPLVRPEQGFLEERLPWAK